MTTFPRDPDRRERILKLIKDIWDLDPDLRLCQIVGNQFDAYFDYYYVEDEDFEQLLIDHYCKMKNARQ